MPINSKTALGTRLILFSFISFDFEENVTTRQGMTSAEIDQIVAQRVTDAIEAIAVYEAKIRMAHGSMN
ncbi:hypothetical protein Tco_1426161 [Tanacetum coccineum]